MWEREKERIKIDHKELIQWKPCDEYTLEKPGPNRRQERKRKTKVT